MKSSNLSAVLISNNWQGNQLPLVSVFRRVNGIWIITQRRLKEYDSMPEASNYLHSLSQQTSTSKLNNWCCLCVSLALEIVVMCVQCFLLHTHLKALYMQYLNDKFSWDLHNRLPFRWNLLRALLFSKRVFIKRYDFMNTTHLSLVIFLPTNLLNKFSNIQFLQNIFDTTVPEASNLAILLTLSSLLHFWSFLKS